MVVAAADGEKMLLLDELAAPDEEAVPVVPLALAAVPVDVPVDVVVSVVRVGSKLLAVLAAVVVPDEGTGALVPDEAVVPEEGAPPEVVVPPTTMAVVEVVTVPVDDVAPLDALALDASLEVVAEVVAVVAETA